MPWICGVQNAHKIPKAAGVAGVDAEREAYPTDTTLADTEVTMPIATNHLKSVTLYFTASGGAVSPDAAKVYQRPSDTEAWSLLIDVPFAADGSASERFECPCGQLRVENSGIPTLVVSAEGIAVNAR